MISTTCPTCKTNRKSLRKAECGACKSARKAIDKGKIERAKIFVPGVAVLPEASMPNSVKLGNIEYHFAEPEKNQVIVLPEGFTTGDLKAEYSEFVLEQKAQNPDDFIEKAEVFEAFEIVYAV